MPEWFCLPIDICIIYEVPMESRRGGQIPPRMKLPMVMNCHVGAGH